MFVTTTVGLPDKPAVITVPETAVDYTLYGRLGVRITEKKGEDGKTQPGAVRTFVVTGSRSVVASKSSRGEAGRQGRAVGQLLQSGAAVAISTDPAHADPGAAPRYRHRT
ncbi:hypothetical protein ACTGJ9_039530 [Bradyrhizobium sp. RDM12]